MSHDTFEEICFMKQTFQCISYDEGAFVMDWKMEPKGFVPTHYHLHMDEHFLVTAGEARFMVNGTEVIAKKGDELMIPKGVPHSIRTISSDPLACRVIYSPCSDTHKMFAIFGGLKREGMSGMKYLLKAEYIARHLGLAPFSTSPGAMGMLERSIHALLQPVARIRGWNDTAKNYVT